MTRRLALALALAAAPAARAVELLSPGELSRAHAALEGTENCTKCHPVGGRLAPEPCLACHQELRGRIAGGKGLHGRIAPGERACERCHHEHEGRDAPLVSWGKEGRAAFDHSRTGTPLAGKHRKADCARCHDPRLVTEPAVRELLAKHPGRKTYLGAPTACWPCHADEHRGQLGTECARCHVDDAWKPAKRFDHAKAAFKLAGRHEKVACEKCHPRQPRPPPEPGASQVAVVSAAPFHFKGLRFGACSDCHKDPHAGKFGASCASCHVVDDWRRLTGAAAEKAFHEKTRFPLRGGHVAAPCRGCHGPFPGERRERLRGLPFAACTDCHADAHLGQIARPAGEARTCDRCHGVEGYLPARFEAEDHAKTRYPLEGAHRAVACGRCHPRDPAAEGRVPAEVRARLVAEGRPVKVAPARLRIEPFDDCRTCHADPHGGQFVQRLAKRGCEECHVVASFRQLQFDHARDSRFPLAGKHAKAACGSCHRPGPDGVVRWRPLASGCDGCHADPHAGQFAADGATDCGRCHETEGWKRLRFEHREPFTAFRLEGRHAPLACAKCHPEVALAGGVKVRRFRPLPTACEGCHADFHKGAFDNPKGVTRCGACHSPAGWDRVAFDHAARTGFALEGAHRSAPCRGCHRGSDFRQAVPRACVACHRDAHAGRMGTRCVDCHDAVAWRETTFGPEAHRRTNFPLDGRHAVLPCEECHADRRDRSFSRATRTCVECHGADLARAAAVAFDHLAAFGNASDCRRCHGTWSFSPGYLPGHDPCFPIRSGTHSGVRCRQCHTSLASFTFSGVCGEAANTLKCFDCHGCPDGHAGVSGFQPCPSTPSTDFSQRCYNCHPNGFGGGG